MVRQCAASYNEEILFLLSIRSRKASMGSRKVLGKLIPFHFFRVMWSERVSLSFEILHFASMIGSRSRPPRQDKNFYFFKLSQSLLVLMRLLYVFAYVNYLCRHWIHIILTKWMKKIHIQNILVRGKHRLNSKGGKVKIFSVDIKSVQPFVHVFGTQ